MVSGAKKQIIFRCGEAIMYQIAICDDEVIFLEHLNRQVRSVLEELGCTFEVHIFKDCRDLLQELEQQPDRYHLVLLDIIMGHLNGVALAKRMRKLGSTAGIIFVTSTATYSLEGYSVYPAQYLVKPVTKQQLFEAIARDYRERYLPRHIMLPVKGGGMVLPLDQIFFLETINRMTLIHCAQDCLESCEALKKLLPLFPQPLFVRCHKSFVVNLQKVTRITRGGIDLVGARQIPVGRAYYDTATRALVDYLEQT